MKAAKSVQNKCANLCEIESYLLEPILSQLDFQNMKFNLNNSDSIFPIQLIKYFDNAARIQVLIYINNLCSIF